MRALRVLPLVLALACFAGCGRPTGVPESSNSEQRLPFDREGRSNGISPTKSLIPSTNHVPEGTALTIRLVKPLSSASAHEGETFTGVLAEPVNLQDQAVIKTGTRVVGRVLDAQPSSGRYAPGYLRITLVSLDVGSKPVFIDTSSVFAKAGKPEERTPGGGSGSNRNEMTFSPDRRLTFYLAQAVDLP